MGCKMHCIATVRIADPAYRVRSTKLACPVVPPTCCAVLCCIVSMLYHQSLYSAYFTHNTALYACKHVHIHETKYLPHCLSPSLPLPLSLSPSLPLSLPPPTYLPANLPLSRQRGNEVHPSMFLLTTVLV